MGVFPSAFRTRDYNGRRPPHQPPEAPALSRPDRLPKGRPRGVASGVWRYVRSEEIARRYDEYFSQNALFDFDQQVLARCLNPPGLVVDLGCGTGRSLVPLARRGLRAVGIDLHFDFENGAASGERDVGPPGTRRVADNR